MRTASARYPALRSNAKAPTRFKTWWRLVESAVENAAEQHVNLHNDAVAAMVVDADAPRPTAIDFRLLFLAQEETDEGRQPPHVRTFQKRREKAPRG
jgi:hypothetical protein